MVRTVASGVPPPPCACNRRPISRKDHRSRGLNDHREEDEATHSQCCQLVHRDATEPDAHRSPRRPLGQQRERTSVSGVICISSPHEYQQTMVVRH